MQGLHVALQVFRTADDEGNGKGWGVRALHDLQVRYRGRVGLHGGTLLDGFR